MPEVYEEEIGKIDNDVEVGDLLFASRLYPTETFSNMAAQAEAVWAYLEAIQVTVSLNVTGSAAVTADGVALRDRIRVGDSHSTGLTFGLLLQEVLRLRDTLATAQANSLTSTVNLQDAISALRGLTIIEQIGLAGVVTGQLLSSLSTFEQIRARDSLFRFVSATASDTVQMAATLASLTRRNWVVSDAAQLSASISSTMVLRLSSTETLAVTDLQALQMLFSQTLSEEIQAEVLIATPDGVTTWAINTRTGAVTEYGNYDFTSFAKLGRRYIGTARDGLYELTGDDDEGEDIIATLKSGAIQFSGTRFSGMRAIYLGINGEGEFFLRLTAGSGETYLYRLLARDMENTKVWVGKGLRHRYMTYELVSTGQDFDLDSIEFVPMRPRRRV